MSTASSASYLLCDLGQVAHCPLPKWSKNASLPRAAHDLCKNCISLDNALNNRCIYKM